MFKDDEVFVWSISSIFSQEGLVGDVLVCKFPFAVVPEKYMRSSTAAGFELQFFYYLDSVTNQPFTYSSVRPTQPLPR